MEGIGGESDDGRFAANFVDTDETVPAVEGRVLLRLRHHRPTGLGESHHELGAQCLDVLLLARELGGDERVLGPGERLRTATLLAGTGVAGREGHHQIQRLEFILGEILAGTLRGLGEDQTVFLGGGQSWLDIGPVAVHREQELGDRTLDLSARVVAEPEVTVTDLHDDRGEAVDLGEEHVLDHLTLRLEQ